LTRNVSKAVVIPPRLMPKKKIAANFKKLMCVPSEGSPPVLGSAKGISEVSVGLVSSMGVGMGVISGAALGMGVGIAVDDGVEIAGNVGVGVFVGVGINPSITST